MLCSHVRYSDFTRVFCVLKCRAVSRYTRKCNFVYMHYGCLSFHAQSFTKLLNARQNHTQIYYADFHQNPTINVETEDRNLFRPLCNYECHCANFHATYDFFTSFFNKNCAEFHENPAAGFVIDCGPKTDRHTDVFFTHRAFFTP